VCRTGIILCWLLIAFGWCRKVHLEFIGLEKGRICVSYKAHVLVAFLHQFWHMLSHLC
jgi:hypothetical protein